MFRTRSDRRKEAVQIVAHARNPIKMAARIAIAAARSRKIATSSQRGVVEKPSRLTRRMEEQEGDGTVIDL